MDLGLLAFVAIVIGSVVPTLLYMIWMWRADRRGGQRFNVVLRAFLVGAGISTTTAIILSSVLLVGLLLMYAVLTGESPGSIDLESGWWLFISAVLIAPFAEELCKAGSVMIFKRRLSTLETGIIIGATVGLGFAAVENILYGISAVDQGLESALLLVGLRSVTAALGHAGYTAISGYGLAKWNRSRRAKMIWVPYYLTAVLLHSFSNVLASLNEVIQVDEWFQMACIGIILVMDVSIIVLLHHRITQLNHAEAEQALPQVQPL